MTSLINIQKYKNASKNYKEKSDRRLFKQDQTLHFTEYVVTFTAEIPYRLQTAMCSFRDKLTKSCNSTCEQAYNLCKKSILDSHCIRRISTNVIVAGVSSVFVGYRGISVVGIIMLSWDGIIYRTLQTHIHRESFNRYTPCFIKNIPLALLLYLSQMLFNDSENWNKYSSVK